MGLDVYLYRLPNIDVEAFVEFDRVSDAVWATLVKRRTKNEPFPTAAMRERRRLLLTPLATSLGLPEAVIDTPVSDLVERFDWKSTLYPEGTFSVGAWDSGFGWTWDWLETILGADAFAVFPQARDRRPWVKPDWVRSRELLAGILRRLRELGFNHPRFRQWFPEDPEFFFEMFRDDVGVMIETIDYVLKQPNIGEFILYWSW